MKKLDIRISTIARILALVVASINEVLIVLELDVLPFSDSMVYKAVSLALMIVVAVINTWYNNDISKVALICGQLFRALSDKKIAEEELDEIIADLENVGDDYHNESTFIQLANSLLRLAKNAVSKSKNE